MSVEIKLSRSDRVYHPGEELKGEILIVSRGSPLQHGGITLATSGSVQLRLSEKSVGVFESLFLSVRPIPLLNEVIEVCPPGTLPAGTSRIPFSLPLRPSGDNATKTLYETYHGININVQYGVAAECERSIIKGGKISTGLIEFIVEERGSQQTLDTINKAAPVQFVLSPGGPTVLTGDTRLFGEGFRISGRLDSGVLAIQRPVSGMVKARPVGPAVDWWQVEHMTSLLRSIELTLGRVEWCTVGELGASVAKEATDIQVTQVADGDIAPGLELPIHMVLPRLYTCPSVSARAWGVEFELTITAVAADSNSEATASVTLPVKLVRDASRGGGHTLG